MRIPRLIVLTVVLVGSQVRAEDPNPAFSVTSRERLTDKRLRTWGGLSVAVLGAAGTAAGIELIANFQDNTRRMIPPAAALYLFGAGLAVLCGTALTGGGLAAFASGVHMQVVPVVLNGGGGLGLTLSI